MSWMNVMEIEEAERACRSHPVLGPATRFLRSLMEAVNDQSDGWPYWNAPSRSAKALMELIEENTGGWGSPRSGINIALKDVEKTLTPIRRMVTVQREKQKQYGNTFEFDVDQAWKQAKKLVQQ